MGKKRHRKKKNHNKYLKWFRKKSKRMSKKVKRYINHLGAFMLKVLMRSTLCLISLWRLLLEFKKVLKYFSEFVTVKSPGGWTPMG